MRTHRAGIKLHVLAYTICSERCVGDFLTSPPICIRPNVRADFLVEQRKRLPLRGGSVLGSQTTMQRDTHCKHGKLGDLALMAIMAMMALMLMMAMMTMMAMMAIYYDGYGGYAGYEDYDGYHGYHCYHGYYDGYAMSTTVSAGSITPQFECELTRLFAV